MIRPLSCARGSSVRSIKPAFIRSCTRSVPAYVAVAAPRSLPDCHRTLSGHQLEQRPGLWRNGFPEDLL